MKKSQQKSLFVEHFYPVLAILFAILTFFLAAAGLGFDESAVIALWVVAILFFIRQVHRYMKGEETPQKKPEKKPLASMPEKKYTPPALPRVSKDFSPLPPAGDKRYPPPSPFIKPPK
ncbi:MAG TPA: hypothetical protein VJN93_07440 [Candidatus Acidoferrum sp.]|nr:hypothetical protein [Candidatus Acidoferrum sp.]